jgi:hypothetical protein
MTAKRKLPFDCTPYIDEVCTITNPFSGDSIEVDGEEAAVYDVIMGANMTGRYDLVRKGCDWFRKYNAKAYMVLLD